jgi:hypothetical protein
VSGEGREGVLSLVRFLFLLFLSKEDIFLIAMCASDSLTNLWRGRVPLHPRPLQIILLVDHLIVWVQENVIGDKEIERGSIDPQLVSSIDLEPMRGG